ncbi:NEL-type E3 ubiquitin ligase domain-containing protein [Pseudomonas prosekii]|nr:NEL-type E3 ubiquitin ligase domain-containing protein [Pseudomonas prosekii]
MPGYDNASAQLRAQWKAAHGASWVSHNNSAKSLGKLQDIESFAIPLLTHALQDQYNLTLDVQSTYLRLYCPTGIARGFTVRTLSLLDASLHNFEAMETRAGYFDSASDFISQPASNGQFDTLPIRHKMSVASFATLCRQLDIGARYQVYLKAFMGFSSPVARAVLEHQVKASSKDALRAASVLALMQQDIDLQTQRMLLALVDGQDQLTLRGQSMQVLRLTMMDAALSDIVIIRADPEHSRNIEPVIAYVPHDPHHPIKHYRSSAHFVAELTAQLRAPEYQRFFSRFVPHQQRGRFFLRLNDTLSKVQWHSPSLHDQTPPWRAEPVANPNLAITYSAVVGEFWLEDFQQKLDRILNDARTMAVPTGDEDAKSRWARWDSLQKVASQILQAAAFLAAPFVPLLGELMLAYSAYQLLDETFEGIIDWSMGQRVEAAGHLIGIAESLIQLGLFAAGGKVVGDVWSFKQSRFVEGMKVVESANGRSRLWNPDLEIYQQPSIVQAHARPDAKGIYRHAGQEAIKLDGKQFVIARDPANGSYRIQHPTRAEAYSPRLAHNGEGAWTHEAERPATWRGINLMRRLGHSVESFSDQTLEHIRIVSGVEDNFLRVLHVEQRRTPALLAETIKRFKVDQDIQPFSDAAPDPFVELLRNDFAQMPRAVMDELLLETTAAERLHMSETGRLPLRLRQSARAATLELRMLRAYEGLYLPASENLDSLRLALHSLEHLPGWSAHIRIELRGLSLRGPLLDSVGAPQAVADKVLVISDGLGVQPYDADGNTLHGFDDFYTSILQALPDANRSALGYEIGHGRRLQQAVQQSPLAQSAFREVLVQRRVLKPVYDPAVMRLRGGMQGYAALELSEGAAPSLEERFNVLYPGADADSFSAFRQSFAAQELAHAALRQLEIEFSDLNAAFETWLSTPSGEVAAMDQRYHKQRFANVLKQCWQAAQSAAPEGFQLNLDFFWTGDFLEHLPVLSANFRHVTALQWRHVDLQGDISGFLGNFPNLRSLDLSHNALTAPPRLPAALEHLNLSSNRLTLTPQNQADISDLPRLQSLDLSDNPALTHAPDISKMPDLVRLDLHNAGIADWPSGLLALPRPRAFELDLQGNPIEHIPPVTPGSGQARLVARARLSRDQLDDQSRGQLQEVMRSVGYDPARSYPPKGEETSEFWLEGDAPPLRETRQAMWDELEQEPNAQGFFEVLEQITESADAAAEGYRTGLTERVWRMLEAISENTALREELFRMAVNPDSCADAGTQIFNEMGGKVLVHEAYLAGSPEQVEAALLGLAKGKSRLDQVNEIARATIQTRLQAGEVFQTVDEDGELSGSIDEVEVYLAFQTGLADRLELPWQSKDMLFREFAEVGDEQIEQAYQSVLALEAGEGLVNRMIEQRFWRHYLKSRHAQDFAQNSTVFNAKSQALLERHLASAVSQQDYERGLIELAHGRKQLLRTLTLQALNRPE